MLVVQVSSATLESFANELHAAIGRGDFHQATKLIHAAPHPSVFQMLNPQQQNAVHLAGEHLSTLPKESMPVLNRHTYYTDRPSHCTRHLGMMHACMILEHI